MSEKIVKIMTKTGDGGMTALADGRRLAKFNSRIEAIGNVDELNSLIGLVLSEKLPSEVETELLAIQHDLFDIGAELAEAGGELMEDRLMRLESQAGKREETLAPLQGFIFPGGVREGALFHYARTVCRRAERSVFALTESEDVSPVIGKYMNRLSDVLFIYARVINCEAGKTEQLWQKNKSNAL